MKNILFGTAAALVMMAMPANAAIYADTVVSSAGGSGSGIYGGAPTIDASIASLDGTGWALGGATGAPGTITLKFSSGAVVDGAGNDLIAFDTFGLDESLLVEASADGVSFFGLGTHANNFSLSCSLATPCAAGFDLAGSGLTSASYFRLTAVQGGCVFAFPECYDLDALEAVSFSAGAVPEPATWAMMLAGFGAVGFAMRRRRSVAVSFA